MAAEEYTRKNDRELAQKAADNDLQAFGELVKRYEKRVFAFLNQKLPDRGTVEELTQDTFVKAYRYIHRFDSRYQFNTWLFTIAQRLAASHFRKNKGIKLHFDEKKQTEQGEPSAEDLTIEREDKESLWAAARQILPPAQYDALYLRYVEEMSVKNIAKTMKKTSTHVKVLLHRARKSLFRTSLNSDFAATPAGKQASPSARGIHLSAEQARHAGAGSQLDIPDKKTDENNRDTQADKFTTGHNILDNKLNVDKVSPVFSQTQEN